MPRSTRRSTSSAAAALALCAVLAAPSQAQEPWPAARISIIVGFAPGGFADTVARVIAKELSERLKQPAVVQNMPGASSSTAARHVSIARPDGYTLLVTTTALAINETLHKGRGFTVESLAPVAIPVSAPESLSSSGKGDIRSFRDLERVSREGRLFVGSAGIGSSSHIMAEYLLKVRAKLSLKHIPFQGGSAALHALLTGDITVMATTAGAATIPAIVRGEAIGLGVAARERISTIPAVPTFAELGFAGLEVSSWAGFLAPASTPTAILERLNGEINDALESPETKARFDAIGFLRTRRPLGDTQAFFKADVMRWTEMISAAGVAQ